MSAGDSFRIISVTGARSRVGKTTLCSILLENLKGFGAVKFTRTSVYTSVTDDPAEIMQKDKDTAVMYASGVAKVFWIRSPGGRELRDALGIAIGRMQGLRGVIVEGNSPVDFLNPHLLIFITGKDGQVKPSAVKLPGMADIIVINSDKKTGGTPFSPSLLKDDAEVFCMDLISKKGEIDKFLAHVKKYIDEFR